MIRSLKHYLLQRVFKSSYRPGHFYSTIPSAEEIDRVQRQWSHASKPRDMPELGLSLAQQKELLQAWVEDQRLSEISRLPTQGKFYHSQNGFFVAADAVALRAVLKQFRPKRIVEVGSGLSTAVMVDAVNEGLLPSAEITCIEPFPDRLQPLLEAKANIALRQEFVQDVDLEVFTSLQANDLLFVDSSHVVKAGSDLQHIMFEVVPRLAPGVLVHFHDIVYPFEYPAEWLKRGIQWNESYLLRAFLTNNSAFDIVAFVNLFQQLEVAPAGHPLATVGGSFYIKKRD